MWKRLRILPKKVEAKALFLMVAFALSLWLPAVATGRPLDAYPQYKCAPGDGHDSSQQDGSGSGDPIDGERKLPIGKDPGYGLYNLSADGRGGEIWNPWADGLGLMRAPRGGVIWIGIPGIMPLFLIW